MPAPQGHGKKANGPLARQRSRNTTPSSVAPPTVTASLPEIQAQDLEYIQLRFDVFRNLSYDDLVDSGTGAGSSIPDYKSIDGIVTRLKKLQAISDERGSSYDRGMRLLSHNRRTRMDDLAAERSREEERVQREANDEDHQRRANKKKRKAPEGTAAQEVVTATPSAMEVDEKTKIVAADDSPSESESSDDGAPPQRPVPQNQTFGEDPSTFPDPTVYEVRAVKSGMSEDEIKEIYSVAVYPKSDLADLVAGDPPDKDFSNAKPSNQINFSTFSSYIEPYFRPFTEEDLAFLRERGDHVTPFHIPKRGKKHYSDIWADEDGAMAVDSSPPVSGHDKRLPPNQPRGNIDSMTDEVAETDRLSVGPLLARLLQAMRPEHRAPPVPTGSDSVNGSVDVSMSGLGDTSVNGTDGPAGESQNGDGERVLPVATLMPESASETWKKATHPKLDYTQVDERIKQELRHIGFLPFPDSAHGSSVVNSTGNGMGGINNSSGGGNSNGNGGNSNGNGNGSGNGNSNGSNGANGHGSGGGNGNGSANGGGGNAAIDPSLTADYDGHYDDEVAARLRLLQSKLREQMLMNGARKARLAELVKERMAYQEYQTILEDLDGQVQAAYLKRTRTMGKSKKGKRPGAGGAGAGGAGGAGGAAGGANGAGTARPGIGDMTRLLMERRRRWMESIGTVFDDERLRRVPRQCEPDSSIFPPAEMAGLIKKEQEAWDEEADEE
ncbi:transcriptional regulator [Grosmannia clavigera kw1407]|uniref:Transcriptional regulator n=1 Tax=Grosmannia clavigera (strain kw1407 / UAMH 11150) TaxID=655863 RepID=F0X9Z6_GROCL|nr:transcriptional regulator [Grosmannia clavigera kw1407]EFX05304.1 transcriptional regulator [Grosmannia clavigera kw1407]